MNRWRRSGELGEEPCQSFRFQTRQAYIASRLDKEDKENKGKATTAFQRDCSPASGQVSRTPTPEPESNIAPDSGTATSLAARDVTQTVDMVRSKSPDSSQKDLQSSDFSGGDDFFASLQKTFSEWKFDDSSCYERQAEAATGGPAARSLSTLLREWDVFASFDQILSSSNARAGEENEDSTASVFTPEAEASCVHGSGNRQTTIALQRACSYPEGPAERPVKRTAMESSGFSSDPYLPDPSLTPLSLAGGISSSSGTISTPASIFSTASLDKESPGLMQAGLGWASMGNLCSRETGRAETTKAGNDYIDGSRPGSLQFHSRALSVAALDSAVSQTSRSDMGGKTQKQEGLVWIPLTSGKRVKRGRGKSGRSGSVGDVNRFSVSCSRISYLDYDEGAEKIIVRGGKESVLKTPQYGENKFYGDFGLGPDPDRNPRNLAYARAWRSLQTFRDNEGETPRPSPKVSQSAERLTGILEEAESSE